MMSIKARLPLEIMNLSSANKLNSKAASFIQLFEHHQPQMQQSVESCRKTVENIKKQEYALKVLLGFVAVIVFALVVHYSLNLYIAKESDYNAGQPILIFCIFATFGVFLFMTQAQKVKSLRSVNESFQDFRKNLVLLNKELEEVMVSCEELRRGLGGSDRVRVMRLEQSVLEVFLLTEGLQQDASVDCVTQVCEEYSRILSELGKMKMQLSFFTGTC